MHHQGRLRGSILAAALVVAAMASAQQVTINVDRIRFTDATITRDAANVLAQKNGANGQEFRTYGSTSSGAYTRLGHNGSAAYLYNNTTNALCFGTSNASRWCIDAAGNFIAQTDGSFEIGATSASRPKNLYLTSTLFAPELRVQTLTAQDVVSTIGGAVEVAPATYLTAALASGSTTMTVKHNNLANGDFAFLRVMSASEWIKVVSAASGSGPYTYTIERDKVGGGAGLNWASGDALMDTGATTGAGFMELRSGVGMFGAAGPAIHGIYRSGPTYSTYATRWILGNLTGQYGYTATSCNSGTAPCFGLAAGKYSQSWFALDDTNGLRLMNGSTPYVQITPTGNATFSGTLTVGTSANLLTNTDFRQGVSEGFGQGESWRNGWGNDPGTWSVGTITGLGYSTPLFGAAYAGNSGTAMGAGYVRDIYGPYVPVVAGGTYEFSAFLDPYRCDARAIVVTYPSATVFYAPLVTDQQGVITALASYQRSGVVFQAPAGDTNALVLLRLIGRAGGSSEYLFFTRPMFAEGHVGQTGLSAWSAGGITRVTGDSIRTGSITAANIAASTITANEIAASTITGDKIAASTITAGKMSVSSLSAIQANLGTVSIDSSGYLRTGTASYGAETGIWMGWDSSAYKYRVGNPSGQRLQWDGSNLDMYGANYELSTSYGLHFNSSSENWANTVNWTSGSRVGSTSGYLYLWGPGSSANTNMHLGGWDVDFMPNGSTLRFRVSNSEVTVFGVDFVPGTNNSISLGDSSSEWAHVYGNTYHSQGYTGVTVDVGVNDSGCASGRRTLSFHGGILTSTYCQ